jgi:hypothetical protein
MPAWLRNVYGLYWVLLGMSLAMLGAVFVAANWLPIPQAIIDDVGTIWMATSICAFLVLLICAVGVILERWLHS